MQKTNRALAFFVILLLGAGLACSVPGFPSSATPVPTPIGNFLRFNVIPPTYNVTLNAGDRVPGAPLEYIGQEGDTYKVRIGGQETVKRTGDSFSWSGIIAPSVFGEYNLRLTTALLGPMPVTGGVQVTLLDSQPLETSVLPDLTNALHFGNILIENTIPVGQAMPASSLVYTGIYTQGSQQFAQFSTQTGQPYYAQGDSIVWTGQLRSNVYVQYNLRVLTFNESQVTVAGTADLWITEQTYP